ncbi:hypothetical protein GCM10010271_24460 [Streptomyces kurssanovii]|nr:hypothetical protein GCM10010271_24460 [Streptomyces kurssanovii]
MRPAPRRGPSHGSQVLGTGQEGRPSPDGAATATRIPVTKVSDARFTAAFADLPQKINRSLSAPSADGHGAIWLGAPVPRQVADPEPQAPAPGQAADPDPQEGPVGVGASALRLLPVVLAAALLLWWRRRRPNAAATAGPRRSAAAPATRDGARRGSQDDFF